MTDRLSDLSKRALKDIRNSSTLEELDSVRVQYLGKKGSVSIQLKNLSDLDPSDRPRIGKEVNKLKKLVDQEITNKKNLLNDEKNFKETVSKEEYILNNCNQCEIQSNVENNFKQHVNFVQEGMFYSCKLCTYTFQTEDRLNTHIKEIHIQNSVFPKCEKKLTFFGKLEISFSCEYCDKQFKFEKDMQNHIKSVHEQIYFACDKCLHYFSDYTLLNNHMKVFHKKINRVLIRKAKIRKWNLTKNKIKLLDEKRNRKRKKLNGRRKKQTFMRMRILKDWKRRKKKGLVEICYI